MDVLRLGTESELQLPAYTTAPATPDLSHLCDLHRSSRQHRILNPRNKARDQTCVFMDESGLLPLSHSGNSLFAFQTYIFFSQQKQTVAGHMPFI